MNFDKHFETISTWKHNIELKLTATKIILKNSPFLQIYYNF